MLIDLGFTLLVVWAFFPPLAVNIGPIPPFVLVCCVLAAASILVKGRDGAPTGWHMYALFSLALVWSQTNAVRLRDTLSGTLGTSLLFLSIPFLSVWLKPESRRWRLSLLILAATLSTALYVHAYVGVEIIQDLARFGPMALSMNSLGFMLAMGVAFGWPMVMDKRVAGWVRMTAFLVLCLSLQVGFFHLGSRSGFLGMLVGMLVGILVQMSKRFSIKATLLPLGFLAAIMLIGLQAYQNGDLPYVIHKKFSLLLNPLSDGSTMIRLSLAKKAWHMFLDFPLTGGGWDNFRFYEYGQQMAVVLDRWVLYVGSDLLWPHSTYWKVLGETGLPGALAFGALLSWLGRSILRLIRACAGENSWEHGAWLWLPVFLLISLFHDTINYLSILLFAFLHGWILSKTSPPSLIPPAEETRPSEHRTGDTVSPGVIEIV